MTDHRAQVVHEIVSMDDIDTLGLAGSLGGVGTEGADQCVNNDTDLGVTQKSYRYISNTRLSTIYSKTGCINMIRHARRNIVAYSCNKLN